MAVGSGPQSLETPRELLEALLRLRREVVGEATATAADWQKQVDGPSIAPGTRNLAEYLALRRHDVRPLQLALMPWGLSSLGRMESRVVPTLDAVIRTLCLLVPEAAVELPERPTIDSFFEGAVRLEQNAREIFGAPPPNRTVRIMVTLDERAATDFDFVCDLLKAGADCLRINCAHDEQPVWQAMVENGRRAARELNRELTICLDLAGQKPRIGAVLVPPDGRRLVEGDLLLLSSGELAPRPGIQFQARCDMPDLFGQLAAGARVCLDDGKVVTRVEDTEREGVLLRVTKAGAKGKSIRPDLGLNFPDSALQLPVLTAKDLADLDFVAENADSVGFSFVQRPEDVARLQEELKRRGRLPALIAKIETAEAVRNLPGIIVQATAAQPLAVMIARGDLAVEIGYHRLAEIQEEIMWLCEAAHVPVVWATQVLERLARKGIPSRAEVTDAAMAERAECVMLNKGPHVLDAVRLLDDLLVRMAAHQWKKTPMLRALHSWDYLAEPLVGAGVGPPHSPRGKGSV
jgi:pyruvate kinase